jgi:hypothetical protein
VCLLSFMLEEEGHVGHDVTFIMHMQEDVAIVEMPMGGTPKDSANNTNLTNTCPLIGPQEPSRPVRTGSSIPSSNLPSSLKKS